MRGAIQIARFFDIPVRVHWSFAFLLVFVGVSSRQQGGTWQDTFWSFLLIGAVFVCVVMHEFGHALMARRFGVETKDIILSPIGGIARLYSLPEPPGQELLVAIAGPLVNLAIAAILWPIAWWLTHDELVTLFHFLTGGSPDWGVAPNSFLGYFIPSLFLLNITLAGFNLLPAFPMDGGRMLRALLAFRLPRLTATRIAARTGQAAAILLAMYSIYQESVMTTLIGIFIFFMANQEYRNAKMEHAMVSLKVGDLLEPGFTRLYLGDTIEMAAAKAAASGETHFLVFQDDDTWVGVLTGVRLEKAAKDSSFRDRQVAEFYKPVLTGLTPNDSLKTAMDRMYYAGSPVLPVFSGKDLAGSVSLGRLLEAAKVWATPSTPA